MIYVNHVEAGDIIYPPGSGFGPRIQSSYQLVMVHMGCMRVWIDDIAHDAAEQTVTLLFPGHKEHFEFAPDRETYHSYAHISIAHLPEATAHRLCSLPRTLPLSESMTRLTRDLMALRQPTLSTAAHLRAALAAQMLWFFVGEGEAHMQAISALPSHSVVDRAYRYIQAHLAADMMLPDIAEAAAVSPAHLTRLFHAAFDTTPMAYVWDQRVQRGLDLLRHSGLSVGLIAERCGFKNPYHFTRRVRRATGLSPTQIRAAAWRA